MLLGIDIGGTSIKLAILADPVGNPANPPLYTARSKTYERPDRQRLVHVLAAALAQTPGEMQHALSAVGVCAPGLVDASGRIIKAVNVPGLEGLTPADIVSLAGQETLPHGLPVVPQTDTHAAAFDFAVTHAIQGRLLAISMGTGIGAAVLDGPDHRPLIVSGRGPGHLGQLDVALPELDANVPIGPDGGRGSLEAYMGLPALRARFGPQLGRVLEHADLHPNHPPLAALVKALRIAHAIYRPNTIALLGGVGIRLSPLIDDLHAAASRDLTGLAHPGWELRSGDSDFHAASGVARLAGQSSR
ncbi:MAG: ROK family protein [Phycisphaerales bacterium]|nr:ROK family protein [Phycisphaerales bacterium]